METTKSRRMIVIKCTFFEKEKYKRVKLQKNVQEMKISINARRGRKEMSTRVRPGRTRSGLCQGKSQRVTHARLLRPVNTLKGHTRTSFALRFLL